MTSFIVDFLPMYVEISQSMQLHNSRRHFQLSVHQDEKSQKLNKPTDGTVILLIIQKMFNLETDDLALKPYIPH